MSSSPIDDDAARPAQFFASVGELENWFQINHASQGELWLGLHKVSSPAPDRGVTWAQAVPVALCFGWIDSVSQRIDDHTRRQRFTPRRPGSTWSAVNVAHVERLLKEAKMRPAGIAAYELRRPERTGTYTHEQNEVSLPAQLAQELTAHVAAAAFLESAIASYRKQVFHWVSGAKREQTRRSRFEQLLEVSSRGEMVPLFAVGARPKWVEVAAAAAARASG